MACLVALISGLTSACVILATVEGGEVKGGQDQAYGDRLGVSSSPERMVAWTKAVAVEVESSDDFCMYFVF